MTGDGGSLGGAALGATVALLVPLGASQSLLLPVLAFAGAWGATVLVIAVSRVAGAVDAAGIAIALLVYSAYRRWRASHAARSGET